jgi:hypothetical protein
MGLRVLGSTSKGGTGMKRTDHFRRQQNPHTGPGLNALVAGLARNDTTGWRRAMLRETRTARQFKGGSDPGVSGCSAATNPLRSSRHCGVAPALG